jgi:four helix bundle protein
MGVRSVKELTVYVKAYELSMRIFEITKRFPKEEQFAVTGQIRRSSRSVCMNFREAWAKRRYPAHFVCKLTDCDGENSETDTSLDFAKDCGYSTADQHAELTNLSAEVGKMLGAMMRNPTPLLIPNPEPSISSPSFPPADS